MMSEHLMETLAHLSIFFGTLALFHSCLGEFLLIALIFLYWRES